MHEELRNSFDYYNAAADRGISTAEHYIGILDSYKSIVDLMGTDALGLTDEFYDDMIDAT
jgi:hypothetical protein